MGLSHFGEWTFLHHTMIVIKKLHRTRQWTTIIAFTVNACTF